MIHTWEISNHMTCLENATSGPLRQVLNLLMAKRSI